VPLLRLSKAQCGGLLGLVANSDLKKIGYFTHHQTIVEAVPTMKLCAGRRSHSRSTTPNIQATFPKDFHPFVKILTKKSFEGFLGVGGEFPGWTWRWPVTVRRLPE
jgi:hypothetical protein